MYVIVLVCEVYIMNAALRQHLYIFKDQSVECINIKQYFFFMPVKYVSSTIQFYLF